MLKVYNPNNPADVIPLPIDDDKRYVTHKYNGYDTLSFEIESNNPLYRYIVEEAKIEDDKNRYVIKNIDEHSNFVTIRCDIDLDDWKTEIIYEYRRTRYYLTQVIDEILPAGWSVEWRCTSTKRTTIEGITGEPMKAVTPLDILWKASEVWSVVFNFEVLSKTLIIIDPSTYTSSGVFFTDEINIKSIGFVGSSDRYATRLYAFGAKDEEGNPMTFADINYGKPYVENYTYSNKIICVGWSDERYSVKENLLEAAKQKLEQICMPSRSYDCEACDLKDDIWMYKVVTLVDRVRRTRVDHQIVEWKEYPNNQMDTITISKTAPNIESFISNVKNDLEANAKDNNETMQKLLNEAVENATGKITGSNGGNFLWIFDANGNLTELVNLTDSMDINTAKSVWRWNKAGLGHSNDGYNGAMTLALLADGSINANVITSGNLTANIIKAGVLSDVAGNTSWNLETGELTSKRLVVDSENFKLNENGHAILKSAELHGSVSSLGGTKYDVVGYFGTVIDQGKVSINRSSKADGSDAEECGTIVPWMERYSDHPQSDLYSKGIKITSARSFSIIDQSLADAGTDCVIIQYNHPFWDDANSTLVLGNNNTSVYAEAMDIQNLFHCCVNDDNVFFVNGSWAYTGDLPVADGYNYNIHVVSGLITGWS